jgi:Polyketide cyclase / dehydrase and lipid transport
MKITLIGLGLLAVFLGSVFIVGVILPRQHKASAVASYRASAEHLYSLIDGSQEWRPDIKHSESFTDDSGRQLMRESSRDGSTISYEVLERTSPTLLRRRIATEGLPFGGSWTYTLQPVGDHTDVKITEEGEIYNPVFRFVARFILGYNKSVDDYLKALGSATGQDVEIRHHS